MPIFEYKCSDCNHVFEKLVPKSNVPYPECPKCKSQKTEKILSVFSGITQKNLSNPTCPSSSICESAGAPCCNHSKCPMS